MKEKLDNLFYYWYDNEYDCSDDNMYFNRYVNVLFQFQEWFEALSDTDLCSLADIKEEEVNEARMIAEKGIDASWQKLTTPWFVR